MKIEERKEALLKLLRDKIEGVLKIDALQKPHNMCILHILRADWNNYKRDIVREVIQHADLNIEINGACGGGYEEGFKTIGLKKDHGLPAIAPEEMEKNIDELLAIDRM